MLKRLTYLIPNFRGALIGILCLLPLSSYASGEPKLQEPDWKSTVNINGETKTCSIPGVEIKSETIDTAGRPLYFVEIYSEREKGPKPLIVLIHGTPGGWSDQIRSHS